MDNSVALDGDPSIVRKFLGPGASTPCMSPTLQLRDRSDLSRIQTQKANMKLPVGPFANTHDDALKGVTLKDTDADAGFKADYQNVTFRERYNHTLSPIPINESRCPIQFTEPRRRPGVDGEVLTPSNSSNSANGSSNRQLNNSKNGKFYKKYHSSLSGSGSSASSKLFPYPNVLEYSSEPTPGQLLFDSLTLLSTYQLVERERQRFGRVKRKDKEKPADLKEREPIELSDTMFDGVNTDAFLDVMHLLFTCLDENEADLRFRDCWPIFEMKMIGAFRRVVLDWIKELIQENPEFFRDFKAEAVSGLLVNCGGERFVSMLHQLTRLVLYKVANRGKASIKRHVLLPPTPVSDPEITNRQLFVLLDRGLDHLESALNSYSLCLIQTKNFKLREVALTELCDELEDVKFESLQNQMLEFPELLAHLAEEDWSKREEYIMSDKLEEDLNDGHCINDPILIRLENALRSRTEAIDAPMSLLHQVVVDQEKVWHALELGRDELTVLDFSEMAPELVMNDNGVPSITTFLSNIKSAVEKLMRNDLWNKDTPPELIRNLEKCALRIKFLELLEQKVNDSKVKYSEVDFAKICVDVEDLKRKYHGFDWSHLSGVPDKEFYNFFEMSPIRVFDMNRRTGRTPAICTFLDTSSSNSSLGDNQGIIKTRRNASMAKPGPRKLNLARKSSSDLNTSSRMGSSSPHLPGYLGKLGSSKSLIQGETPSKGSSGSEKNGVSLLRSYTESSSTPTSSSTIRKSVSFLDNPFSSSNHSLSGDRNWEVNNAASTPSTGSPTNTTDAQNCSVTSDSDEPCISAAVQERLQRLLESAASSNTPRNSSCFSRSLIIGNGSNSGAEDVGPELDEEMDNSTLVISFENISMTHDWADVKGIMETSHIDMNSDSDD